MDRLWAIWRMAYIDQAVSSGGAPQACIFCELPEIAEPKESMVVARRRYAFAVLNIFPYNTGHTMVAPFRHCGSLEELDKEELIDLFELTRDVVAALRKAYTPDGFNVGMNLGRVAGAGFPDHLHVHVVPRWSGDTNFMPVIAETKVLPEDLETTFKKVTAALESGAEGTA